MRTVILAGGLGTRLAEETALKPKPMVEIGGMPILWHIMKTYSHYGLNDFVVCLGYKGYVIKEYFANYFLHMSDVTFNMTDNEMIVHRKKVEPWKVTLIDTGMHTMTGGRLRRVREYLGEETFCMTYGDGVGDIDIPALIERHRQCGKAATITAVTPPGRFGRLDIDDDGNVDFFTEKPAGAYGSINGGYFVLEPKVFDYIEDDSTVWELSPLEGLARDGELSAYTHRGFWRPMDTLRDKTALADLWDSGKAPWKVWG